MYFVNIGRVLDVGWFASSWRAVKSVWRTFPALSQHFHSSSLDISRDTKSRSKDLVRHKSADDTRCKKIQKNIETQSIWNIL
ncbi:unnamed protein product [Macrosiphum euphorbiae]|uniref:Uncharacterized protein n=1 Tax=Macrosiphum euphorbiae TaxID=13131 RepID=A0AAV0YCI2_9HEMI|nr:unnamed protein product [Macrosiphum euphorbiae]